MNAKKIIVSGLAAGIAIFVIYMAASIISQSIFKYDVMALGGMRTVGDPILLLFFFYPFVLGLTTAFLFDFAKSVFKGNNTQKGISLGILGWVVYSIPSSFVVLSSMTYPLGFTINNLVAGLIAMIAAGIIITKLAK